MRILNEQIISGGVMTGTTVVNSDPLWLGHAGGCAIQAVWTGTATGTLKLQGSCDASLPTVNGPQPPLTNWTDIADQSYSVTAPGTYLWNIDGAFYPWVRLVYTNATNTGTLNARGNTKGF